MKYNPADIHEFPSRPERVQIGSRTYALSNIGVPMVASDGDEPPAPIMGAKMVDMGGDRWRYIWVWESESDRLEMYRLSDGDWKVIAASTDYPETFDKLDRLGQLNAVTPEEMAEFEQEMRERYDETLLSLKQAIDEGKSDEDRRVDELVAQFFRERVEPELRRRWAEIAQGVRPFDFEYNERLPRPEGEQARMHVLHKELDRTGFMGEPLEDYVVEALGYSSWEEMEDPQAVDWAARDFLQEVAYPLAGAG